MAKRRSTIPRVWNGTRYDKPKNPIKPGAKGTGQRMIYRAGGGQFALDVWQSLSQERRQQIRKKVGKTGKPATTYTAQVAKNRKKRGVNPRTGQPRGASKPLKPITPTPMVMPKRPPSRMRTF